MSRSLDKQDVRIKGTSLTTKVRYCYEDGEIRAVVELWYHPDDPAMPDELRPLLTEQNVNGDDWALDQLEVADGRGGYMPIVVKGA